MVTALIVLLGALCGLLGCVPTSYLCKRVLHEGRNDLMGLAAASLFASFVVLSLVLVVVRILAKGWILIFGASLAVAFIAFWSVEAIRGCRFAAESIHPEGKEE